MLTSNVIDRTNRFYIEMSRKVLSEKEYDILHKLLIEKMTLKELGGIYGVTGERIRQIYERTYKKVQSITELLSDVDHYKEKLQQLKHEYKCETGQLKKWPVNKTQTKTALNKTVYASHFPFSARMCSIFEALNIHTIGQLTEITLRDFMCFRGFGTQLKKELIAFIEFENIEHLFEGFSAWKTQPIE